jgi:hypothetical protein
MNPVATECAGVYWEMCTRASIEGTGDEDMIASNIAGFPRDGGLSGPDEGLAR